MSVPPTGGREGVGASFAIARAAVRPTLEANVAQSKKLAAHAVLAVAVAALVGASAFAESRPENGTRARRDEGGAIRRERTAAPSERRRGDETPKAARGSEPRVRSGSSIDVRGSRPSETRDRVARDGAERRESGRRERAIERGQRDESYRNRGESPRNRTDVDRNRSTRDRADIDRNRAGRDRHEVDRNRSARGRSETYRDSSRGRNEHYRNRHESRSRHYERYGRKPYYASGRVSRFHRHGNGYRVWVHGAPYPFFVPLSHWHHDRFRVGLMIRLGGWYNDAGYYDYYDGRSSGELYGIVESVDYRRNTFVVQNEATGSFVTVYTRDYEADRLRPGDVVELYGDWTRSGVFQARDVDLIDSYRR
jgi:hypothetical protein